MTLILNTLEFLQNEKDNLRIDRAAYEALHDGKADELYDIERKESMLTAFLGEVENFIDKENEKTVTKGDIVILDCKQKFRDEDNSTSYGLFYGI